MTQTLWPFAEVLRYQRRERGDQGQQGAEDWLDAQEGNVRSHLDSLLCHILICLYIIGIEDLHKVLQKLFVPEFFSVIAAKASLVSLVSQGLIVSRSSFVGISRIHKSGQDSDLQILMSYNIIYKACIIYHLIIRW